MCVLKVYDLDLVLIEWYNQIYSLTLERNLMPHFASLTSLRGKLRAAET